MAEGPSTTASAAVRRSRAANFGPLPGHDFAIATDIIAGELTHRTLPYLPEAENGRGARHADSATAGAHSLVARTAAMLEGFGVQPGPRGLVLTAGTTRFSERIQRALARQLDEVFASWGATSEHILVPLLGPATLSYQLEMPNGYPAITDAGARRDIGAALVELSGRIVGEIQRRCAASTSVLIVDPAAVAAVQGTLPGVTDFDTIAALGADGMASAWQRMHQAAAAASCSDAQGLSGAIVTGVADPVGWELALRSGVRGLWVSRDAINDSRSLDTIAAVADAGLRVGVGIIEDGDYIDEDQAIPRQRAIEVAKLVDDMQLGREWLSTSVDVLPNKPLSSGQAVAASKQLACARRTAEMLVRDAGDL
ncbi:hypothetical protein [Corynebacterium aquilae]|uniref:Methionine synthase n=1 Tax=Corynebacterium aquilae DSM 44791 TaxID=1431546 RepID=A0A1L7CFE3_9CORY|nr:hypothetical protein [Corynebacterium aquilae]APT84581.1 hypothetical protein CAQU_05335 [Corynebacterium aquilae DSM 44791]